MKITFLYTILVTCLFNSLIPIGVMQGPLGSRIQRAKKSIASDVFFPVLFFRYLTALGSQFHSYYVYGERRDCSQLKEDYDLCLKRDTCSEAKVRSRGIGVNPSGGGGGGGVAYKYGPPF